MMIDNPLVIIVFIIGFFKGFAAVGKWLKSRGVDKTDE